jgi:viroplasmin and RNaseH domain-containing protein
MAKKNFYAVKAGKKIGIFYTWDECKKSVDGFPNAKYQGFATIEEANEFLGIAIKVEEKVKKTDKQKKSSPNNKISNNNDSIKPIRSKARVEVFKEYIDYEEIKDKYEFIAFVDGSYDKHSKTYGSGVIVLNLQSNEYKPYHCAGYDKWEQWNIVGELEATKLALNKAKEEYKAKNVAIYHDLKNISLWASGEWQAKNEYTQDYVRVIEEFSLDMNICFVKVKAHSDESIYNDLADKAAKYAIEEYKDRHDI